MTAPTSLTVQVDDTEYSRYEENKNTITSTITVSGGAPYSAEPILLELIKARRSRDAVVATEMVMVTGSADPVEVASTFFLPDVVDQDLISLVRHGKYFVRASSLATSATASIGSGTNGTVVLTADPGLDGNDLSVEVVVPIGTSPLSVSRIGDAITVSLATNGGVPVAASNTPILIRNLLNATYDDLTASTTGNGSVALTIAEGPTAFTGGSDLVTADTDDFNIRIVSVERLKRDYLFGIPLKSTNVKLPKFQPQEITGVVVAEVSPDHPDGFASLNYTYLENDTANATTTIGSGANGTVTVTADGDGLTGSAGNSLLVEVVVPGGTSALSVSYASNTLTVSLDVTGGVPNAGANTATLIAAAIDSLSEFSATASGTGADALSSAEPAKFFTGGLTDIIRQISWRNGPLTSIKGSGTYILKAGLEGPAAKLLSKNSSKDYICVRVRSTALLPETSTYEDILISTQEITDETLGRYLDNAIDWVEKDFLDIFVEPTNVVTDRDPTTIQYAAGVNAPTPIFTDTDYDFLVSPLTYFVPKSPGDWVKIWTPYRQLLRVDSLFGSIANTRVIDIDLEWIEHSQQGGLIQLVPFNQEVAFDFVGLIWVNAIRGAAELPNFWHFNIIAGLREACGDIQELIGKKAAIEALQAASLAFRPGLGSLSLSRDGVSESVSYNTTQQYGVFTGTISAYNEWIKENEGKLKAKYRGLDWAVV